MYKPPPYLLRRSWPILLVILLASIVLSLALSIHGLLKSTLPAPSNASLFVSRIPVLTNEPSAALPSRLKIAKINVDAAIDSVGLTPQGAMGVPTGPSTTAWFNLGPRPGEKGSAVIDGHFGWKNNQPAVFDNLSKLKKGDQLSVEDVNGLTTVFIVSELRIYDQFANAADVFSSTDGKAHLNLITCQGAWNKTKQSYPNRLVVFSDLEVGAP